MAGIPVSVTNPVRLDAKQNEAITLLLKSILQTVVGCLDGPNGSPEEPIHVALDLAELVSAVNRVADTLSQITQPPAQQFHFEGGGFMHTYKEDRPDEVIRFTKPPVVDSENKPVDPQPPLDYTFSSDKENIFSVTSAQDNGDGTVDVGLHYETAVKLDDGSYDIAELRAESNSIDTPAGPIKDVKTEQIQLVPGDAFGFGGGGGFALPDA